MSTELKQLCKSLRLAYVADIFETVEFESQELYLKALFQKEIELREQAKAERLIKRARFRQMKTLASFQWSEQIRFPSHIDARELCQLHFIDQHQNVILTGSPGTGNYRKNLVMERNECALLLL